MAFPYLIKVTRYYGGDNKPYLGEVVVVRGENSWRRFSVNGSTKSSLDYDKGERWRFNNRQTAIDALTGLGKSSLDIDFKENASDAQIKQALQELQNSRTELKKPKK